MKITNEIGKAVKSLNDEIKAYKLSERDALAQEVADEFNENDKDRTARYDALYAKIESEQEAQIQTLTSLKNEAIATMQAEIVDADGTGLIAVANAFVQADADLDSALEDSQAAKVSRWETRIAFEGNYGDDFLPGWNSYAG